MSDEYDPLSPADLQLLVGLAGPIYAESRLIESYSSDNPVNNGQLNDGSMKIKNGLEQMQRFVQVSPPPPPINMSQAYIQTQPLTMPNAVAPTVTIPESTQPIPSLPINQSSTDQFEFNFNVTEQKKTNDLLEGISKKLTKIIGLLTKEK